MSDMSDSNSTYSSTSSNKRRISQIDDNIEQLTQEVNSLNNFIYRTELECSLMTVRVKREKLKALTAIAKSQVLMANMQVLVAESELYTDIERLKMVKKNRLDSVAGSSQRHSHQAPTPQTTSTVAVQTTNGTSKKKTRHSSSKKTSFENTTSRKPQVDISSEETVLIPSIYESNTSVVEKSQTSLTSVSRLFDKAPVSRSGSDVSLSSSVKAEFSDPFTLSQTKETVPNSPAKKHKSDKKETKHKSKSQSRTHEATSVSFVRQSQSPKTVAELRRTENTASKHTESISRTISTPTSRAVDKKSSASATFVPARHNNLPQIVPQPSTSAKCPVIYVNPVTETNTQYNSVPQDPKLHRLLPFYSVKQ